MPEKRLNRLPFGTSACKSSQEATKPNDLDLPVARQRLDFLDDLACVQRGSLVPVPFSQSASLRRMRVKRSGEIAPIAPIKCWAPTIAMRAMRITLSVRSPEGARSVAQPSRCQRKLAIAPLPFL